MNTLLEKLFEIHELSQKDRFEIRQIFNLLPEDKKRNLLNNFESLVAKINIIQDDIRVERQILLGEALIDIKNILSIIRK